MYRILDLCCGAGGCAVGYRNAGFEVVGVDFEPQPHYPFEFHLADAMKYPLDGFDAIHASPPCQTISTLRHFHNHVEKPGAARLLAMQARLRGQRLPYVIENVPPARMKDPVLLCGSMFNCRCGDGMLRRHRLFECSFPVPRLECDHSLGEFTIGVYGGGARAGYGIRGTAWERQQVMGIDWMTRNELNQAIPPVYTEYIGTHLRRHLDTSAAS